MKNQLHLKILARCKKTLLLDCQDTQPDLAMLSENRSLKINPILRQVCASTASGLHNVGQMVIWGMSSLSIVQEEDPSSPEQHPILTPDQFSWFASLPLLLAIPGALLGGVLTEHLGPRKFQLLMAPVLAISLAAMQVASWGSVRDAGLAPTALLIIRAIQSLETGSVLSVVCQYPCEIADFKLRGILASLADFWGYSGFVLCYLTGYFWHWTTISWVLPLVTFLPSFFLLLISPESPVWLSRKGREEEASEALSCLRETPQEVLDELNAMKEDLPNETSWSHSFRLLTQRCNAKPLAISTAMPVFKEFAGNIATAFFMIDIFKLAGVNMHPNLCSLAVGCVRVISNFIGPLLLHRLPRKLLLLSGATIVGIANGVLGVFYYLQASGTDISHINWLPLVMLIIFMIGYGIALGCPTWLVSTEILPNSIRSVGCGIVFAAYSATAFITTKTFSYLTELIGLHGIFWFYSASCFAYGIFIVFVVPETRGLTLKEIEEFWKE